MLSVSFARSCRISNRWCLAVALVAGCEHQAGAASAEPLAAPLRSDGAGIEVVRYTRAHLDALPTVAADTVPVLVIGAVDGPQGATLDRPGPVYGSAHGHIVLADDGGTTIRIYASDGRHLGMFGRPGVGPGEYRRIRAIGTMPGDSLAVFDLHPDTRRVSILGPTRQYVRSVPLDNPLRVVAGEVVPLGGLTAATYVPVEDGRQQAERLGVGTHEVREQLALVMLRGESGVVRVDTLDRVPGMTWLYRVEETVRYNQRQFVTSGRGSSCRGRPHLDGNEHGIAFAHGDQLSVRRYGADGRLRQIIHIAAAPGALTESQSAACAAADRQGFRGAVYDVPDRNLFNPLIRSVALDARGNIWIRTDPVIEKNRGWLVIAPDGTLLAWHAAHTNAGWLQYIGSDYALYTHADELGVESVRQYRVSRW